MIHYKPEGGYARIGFNITLGHRRRWPWITLIWCWYDVQAMQTFGWRLRIRTHMRPFFLFSRHRQPVVDTYCEIHDKLIVDRTLIEDQAPYIAKLMQYYKERNKVGA